MGSAINRCADVFDTQQLSVCISNCCLASIASWQLLLADVLLAAHAGSSDGKQRLFPPAGSPGPCPLCLILARPCSCSVCFGMWSGARRLIAACQAGQVLLLDAPGCEEPLKAGDMLLNGYRPGKHTSDTVGYCLVVASIVMVGFGKS